LRYFSRGQRIKGVAFRRHLGVDIESSGYQANNGGYSAKIKKTSWQEDFSTRNNE
jgi:hypothetical protein